MRNDFSDILKYGLGIPRYKLIEHYSTFQLSALVCLVTWPSSGIKAGVDFLLIQTSMLLIYVNEEQRDFRMKGSEVCNKPLTGSIGQ